MVLQKKVPLAEK